MRIVVGVFLFLTVLVLFAAQTSSYANRIVIVPNHSFARIAPHTSNCYQRKAFHDTYLAAGLQYAVAMNSDFLHPADCSQPWQVVSSPECTVIFSAGIAINELHCMGYTTELPSRAVTMSAYAGVLGFASFHFGMRRECFADLTCSLTEYAG